MKLDLQVPEHQAGKYQQVEKQDIGQKKPEEPRLTHLHISSRDNTGNQPGCQGHNEYDQGELFTHVSMITPPPKALPNYGWDCAFPSFFRIVVGIERLNNRG